MISSKICKTMPTEDSTEQEQLRQKILNKIKTYSRKLTNVINKIIELDKFYDSHQNPEEILCHRHQQKINLYCANRFRVVCPECLGTNPPKNNKFKKPNSSLNSSLMSVRSERRVSFSSSSMMNKVKKLQESNNDMDQNIRRWNFEMRT